MGRYFDSSLVWFPVLFFAHFVDISIAISKVSVINKLSENPVDNSSNANISDRINRPKLHSCICGLKHHTDIKIVGGILSKQHCWPWVAAIVYVSPVRKPKVVCGASVVGKRHLVTAAHCIDYIMEQGIENFRVILGTNDLNDEEAVTVPIESVVPHPKYDEEHPLDYDVGIITLSHGVQFSQSILPICLTPQKGVPYTSKSAIVAGWGSTYFGGATTTMQMQVMIGVISNVECQTLYSNDTDTQITNTMMCARSTAKPLNQDSCQGDSGGPLFLLQEGTNDRYIQVGIVSFGKGCGDKRYPGIYSRVSRFTKWIMRRIGSDGECALGMHRNSGRS